MSTLAEDFTEFWARYPRRVAKITARKAFDAARKQATQAEILEGIKQYVQHKPDWQAWAFPASWLRAGRWLDEYDDLQPKTASDWWEDCKTLHNGTCACRWDHDIRMRVRGGA